MKKRIYSYFLILLLAPFSITFAEAPMPERDEDCWHFPDDFSEADFKSVEEEIMKLYDSETASMTPEEKRIFDEKVIVYHAFEPILTERAFQERMLAKSTATITPEQARAFLRGAGDLRAAFKAESDKITAGMTAEEKRAFERILKDEDGKIRPMSEDELNKYIKEPFSDKQILAIQYLALRAKTDSELFERLEKIKKGEKQGELFSRKSTIELFERLEKIEKGEMQSELISSSPDYNWYELHSDIQSCKHHLSKLNEVRNKTKKFRTEEFFFINRFQDIDETDSVEYRAADFHSKSLKKLLESVNASYKEIDVRGHARVCIQYQ